MFDNNLAYEEELDEAILSLRFCGDFDTLMVALGEPHPPAVLKRVHELVSMGRLDGTTAQRLSQPGQLAEARHENDLPVPHFQDGDWRFTWDTSEKLSRAIINEQTGQILLIGAPSVFSALLRTGVSSIVTAVDASAATVEALNKAATSAGVSGEFSAKLLDVARAQPLSIVADTIFMDPPWYNHYVEHFLWFAAMHCQYGARVFCVFPGKLTRPGIGSERLQQIALAETFGLNISDVWRKYVRYESPPFELNALAAQGIELTAPWRCGDLLMFERARRVCDARPSKLPSPAWGEFLYKGVRFRTDPLAQSSSFSPLPLHIKGTPFDEGRQSKSPISDVYSSTSRRTDGFSYIRIMTSGQQAFACENTEIFLTIGKSLERGDEPCMAVQWHLSRSLTVKEVAIIRRTICEIDRIAEHEPGKRGRL